jgi:hypothetical protein
MAAAPKMLRAEVGGYKPVSKALHCAKKILPKNYLKGMRPSTLKQLLAVFRRHEIDEGRSAIRLYPTEESAPLFNIFGPGHISPRVVEAEGRNLVGLSPKISNILKRLRSHEYANPADRFFDFGIEPAFTLSALRNKPKRVATGEYRVR